MRRGDIVLANLAPTIGSEARSSGERVSPKGRAHVEAADKRPVVIVSNDGANRAAQETGRGVVTVVPLTSNVSTVHVFQLFIPSEASGLRADSKAQAEQIRAVSPARISATIGRVPDDLMIQLDQALRHQLDL
jgi:mRNA interferase MazF